MDGISCYHFVCPNTTSSKGELTSEYSADVCTSCFSRVPYHLIVCLVCHWPSMDRTCTVGTQLPCQLYSTLLPLRVLTVASDVSGIDMPLLALQFFKQHFDIVHVFASEIDKGA